MCSEGEGRGRTVAVVASAGSVRVMHPWPSSLAWQLVHRCRLHALHECTVERLLMLQFQVAEQPAWVQLLPCSLLTTFRLVNGP